MTDLPNGWRLVTLNEVGRWGGGGTPSKANPSFWSEGTIPWISSKDVKQLVLTDSELHITEEAIKGSSTRLVPKDSIAVVARSGILEHTLPVALVPFPATFNQDLKVVTPNSDVLAKYLLFALRAYEQTILGSCRKAGTTVASIEWPQFLRFHVPLPPLAEQERIVEILEENFSHLDCALASVKAVREKAKAFRRSLLHSAFNGELTGGTEGWREIALGDIAKWSSGGTPKSKDPKFYGGEIPWCVIGDLTEGLVHDTAQNITTEGLNASSAKVVPEGTVMVAMYGASIGRVGVAARPMATNQAIACAVVDEEQASRWYLLHYLASQKRAFNEAGQGAAQPNISQTLLKAWPAALPPLATQERIVSLLEEQFSRLDNALAVTHQLEARIASKRRSLLHAAFTGALTAQWRETHV